GDLLLESVSAVGVAAGCGQMRRKFRIGYWPLKSTCYRACFEIDRIERNASCSPKVGCSSEAPLHNQSHIRVSSKIGAYRVRKLLDARVDMHRSRFEESHGM